MSNPESLSLFSPQDALRIETLSCPALSEDGRLLAYQKTTPRADGYETQVVLSFSEPGGSACFTGHLPAVSPAGDRLAYFTPQEELTIVEVSSGKCRSFGKYHRPDHLSWSPDGSRLLFSAKEKQPFQPADLPSFPAIQWVDRLKFKTDGEGIWDGGYRQIFCLDLESGCRRITGRPVDHRFPFWVGADRAGYVVNLHDPDSSDWDSICIHTLSTGTCQAFAGPGGPVSFPAADPQGRQIAFLSHDNHAWEATNFNIFILSLNDGAMTNLTRSLDRSVGNQVISEVGLDWSNAGLRWSPDGKEVYALLTDRDCCHLYLFDTLSHHFGPVVQGERCLFSYGVSTSRIVFVYTSPQAAVVLAQWKEGEETVLWQMDWLSQKRLPLWEPFVFPGFDGSDRQGYYIPPFGSQKGTVLSVHGGPHFCYGKTFFIDAYLLSAQGYGVVICNPAGSQGSGEALSRASKLDWGGKDYRELMTCVQTAQKKFSLPKERWGIMGGSYGGFMTNWAIGHTDFFQCAIAERSTCNRYSQAGTSDCAFRYGEFEFDGFPWDHPEHYLAHSPISYVRSISTPLLLIHGDQDMNCAISQSEEMFSALRLLKKEVYFARFPGQYHTLSETGSPPARLDRYRLILWWFGRYLKGEDKPC